MNAILFGFKGCGKSFFGKLFAEKLQKLGFDYQFIDTDDRIIQLYAEESGQTLSPRQIYQSIGELGFRLLEKKVISSLTMTRKAVIALGGGAVLNPENVESLNKIGQLIYLEASLETIKKREITLLEGPIERLYSERMPIYRLIAAPSINTDIFETEAVLAQLCSIITKETLPHGF